MESPHTLASNQNFRGEAALVVRADADGELARLALVAGLEELERVLRVGEDGDGSSGRSGSGRVVGGVIGLRGGRELLLFGLQDLDDLGPLADGPGPRAT